MGELTRLTIEGKDYVLLPEADYQDIIDIRDAAAAQAKIAAGEETWPEEVVGALVAVGNGVNDGLVDGQLDPTGVVLSEAHLRRDTLGDRSNQFDEFEFAVY